MAQSPTKYVTQIRKQGEGGKKRGEECVCVCLRVCFAFQVNVERLSNAAAF